MQTFEIYFVAITAIHIWINVLLQTLAHKTNGVIYIKRKYTGWLDMKPFNCAFCLTFWVGLTLSVCYLDIFYLTLPIGYKLINKLI